MSHRGIIQKTTPAKCDFCGKIKELRPYGPNGENICFECGTKDTESTKVAAKRFLQHVMGEGFDA